MVTTTGTRFPRSKDSTTASGTTMPTLLPPVASRTVRKLVILGVSSRFRSLSWIDVRRRCGTRSDVLVELRPPRLVLVREPDLLRVERADQPLAFGARLVQLAEEDRHVAADDDRTP